MNQVIFKDLGQMPYKQAWDLQQEYLQSAVDVKRFNRKAEESEYLPQKHHLLFCEHPPVYTLGRSGDINNLLLNEEGLHQEGIEFFKINRGGDITYHGHGQIVGYPILDLDFFFSDIHKYVRFLEEIMIRTIAEYGLKGERIKGESGVWLAATSTKPPRKICAIGIHLKRWITMHGFAFNVNTNLNHFNFIVPCGIQDKGVTSLQQELGRVMDMEEVKAKVKFHFENLFECKLVD